MSPARLFLAVLIAASAFGCAPRSPDSGSASPQRTSDVLARPELAQQQWRDAYALVEGLRPAWLRPRGRESIQGDTPDVQVYMNDMRLGASSQLHTIAVQDIERIEYLSPVAAAARYGVGHSNGAILVYLRLE